MNIALLGAECTGKSTLAQALVHHFSPEGTQPPRAVGVPEHLRAWCTRMGRTPQAHEQAAIAHAQAQALDTARACLPDHGVLVADTTPLMTAIYSRFYFQDESLLPFALAQQARFSHTLVMALDLPWQADGFLRDGPMVAQAIDDLLRQTLEEAGVPFQVIHGRGTARLAQALAALQHPPVCAAHGAPWQGCATCSDARAERLLFSGLLTSKRLKNKAF